MKKEEGRWKKKVLNFLFVDCTSAKQSVLFFVRPLVAGRPGEKKRCQGNAKEINIFVIVAEYLRNFCGSVLLFPFAQSVLLIWQRSCSEKDKSLFTFFLSFHILLCFSFFAETAVFASMLSGT